jgi:hypothetical protein
MIPSRTLQNARLARFSAVALFLTTSLAASLRGGPTMSDFVQEYLLAKAPLERVNPYLPLVTLEKHFGIESATRGFLHPTPHPPGAMWLGLPFVQLPFVQASYLWGAVQIITFALALLLVCRELKPPAIFVAFYIAVLCFPYGPWFFEIFGGSMNAILLLLLVLAWIGLRHDQAVLTGVTLGLAVAFKITFWPLILLLLLRRKWQAALVAGTVALCATTCAVLFMGGPGLITTYLRSAAIVQNAYRDASGNISLWSAAYRTFAGVDSAFVPLVNNPALADRLAWVAPVLALCAGFALALRARRDEIAFAMIACVSILVSPIAWIHYALAGLLPLALCAPYIIENFRSSRAIRWTLALVLVGFNREVVQALVSAFAVATRGTTLFNWPLVVSSLIMLCYVIQVAAIICLIYWLVRCDGLREADYAGQPRLIGRQQVVAGRISY